MCTTLYNDKGRDRRTGMHTHTHTHTHTHKHKHTHTHSAVGGHIGSGPGKRLFMAWHETVYMPYTSHIKQTNARTHFTSGNCVCAKQACVFVCVCVCVCFQCKHRAISPDQTLVCSWHSLLGYDTSRERKRTQ